mmetsp:Transcript_30847/g.102739  ORF Transcript_30847/g.102739 Transcript_30847/m.102739 type:complete len:515 (+) Transcript_30847:302-1846(+)
MMVVRWRRLHPTLKPPLSPFSPCAHPHGPRPEHGWLCMRDRSRGTASILLADDLGEGDVLASVGSERHPEVNDLLGGAADKLVLDTELGLLGHNARVDPREVRTVQLFAVLLGVASQVADAASATLVEVIGASFRHSATDGTARDALVPGLLRGCEDTVDRARVPDDQVTRLRQELRGIGEGRQVAILQLHEDSIVADRLIAVRAQQVLGGAVVLLAAPVHGTPPAHGIGEADRTILVVLMPTEALVGVHEQHVRGHSDLLRPTHLGEAVAQRRVVEEVTEAVVGHPHVPLDVVVEAAGTADQGPDVRVLNLEIGDGTQKVHPLLASALDHDDAVLLKLKDLRLCELQPLAVLPRHDAGRQRHLGVLHSVAEPERIDGLGGDAVPALRGLGCHQAPEAVARQDHAEHREDIAADGVRIGQHRRADHHLQFLELARVDAHGAAGDDVLRGHACEGQHGEAAVLQLPVLLDRKGLDGRLLAGAEAEIARNLVLVNEQAPTADALQHGHDLRELPDR